MAARNEGHEAKDSAPSLRRHCEATAKTGKSTRINVWVDPRVRAGNDDQIIYK